MGTLFNRHFVLLWQGQLVSQFGNQAFLLAATYFALEGTGSASVVAIVMMAFTLPLAIVGPFGGAIADRHSRRTILVVTDLLRSLTIGSVGLYLVFSPQATSLHLIMLVVAAGVSGIMGALFAPAAQAVIPDLVPSDRLASANALTQMSGQTCSLIGQALGGVLYVAWGAAALLLFDAASFAYAGLSTWFIPADRRRDRTRQTVTEIIRQYVADTREGLLYVWHRRGMVSLLVIFAGVNMLFMPVFVLLPLYVRDVLGRGPEWYGFLLSASGGGALAGSLAAGTLATKAPHRGRLMVRSVAGIAICVLALASTRQPAVALTAFVIIGMLSSLINVMVITIFQSAAPTEVRGRVMAVVIALSTAAVPIGMGAGGLLGDVWRDSLRIVFGGCGVAIGGLIAIAWSSSAFADVLAPEQSEAVF